MAQPEGGAFADNCEGLHDISHTQWAIYIAKASLPAITW